MRRTVSRSTAAISCLLVVASLNAARRPRYGGTLRIDVSEAISSLDPADVPADPFEAALRENIMREVGPFHVAAWEPRKAVVLEANDQFAAGRPYLDRVEIHMGRSLHDQALDRALGKADVVELSLSDVRRVQQRDGRLSESDPCLVIALAFGGHRADLDRMREAITRAIDRSAIQNVLLQKQGDISGALLPQWLSGYAFLFPTARDLGKAKELAASSPPLSFSWDSQSSLLKSIAERIVVDAAEAGIALRPATGPQADVRLVMLRIASEDAGEALRTLGGTASTDPSKLFEAERALMESRRLAPLFHLPVVYELSPGVNAWTTGRTGNWRLEDVWLGAARP